MSDILILGTGALATLFAARLASSGARVTVLGNWMEGLSALNTAGACLDGIGAFPVCATADPADCRGAKLALVLVKSWQTERAARQLADCLAADGVALTLQNGLGNEDILAAALGSERVGRGVTTLGAYLLAPGRVRMAGEGPVTLEAHPRLDPLAAVLQRGDFPVQVTADVQSIVWGKLAVNAAINPLTALLRVKNGGLLEHPPVRLLMGELAREAASVAEALGVVLPYGSAARAAEEVARQTAENRSSMLCDILRNAPTEVDAINGAVVRLGEAHEVPVPVNRIIWSLVGGLSSGRGNEA